MQRRTKVRTVMAMVATTAALVTGVLIDSPGASAAPAEEHCVVHVTGQRPSGELRTTAPVCAPTRALALQRSGVTTEADVPIGYHFDGKDRTGS